MVGLPSVRMVSKGHIAIIREIKNPRIPQMTRPILTNTTLNETAATWLP